MRMLSIAGRGRAWDNQSIHIPCHCKGNSGRTSPHDAQCSLSAQSSGRERHRWDGRLHQRIIELTWPDKASFHAYFDANMAHSKGETATESQDYPPIDEWFSYAPPDLKPETREVLEKYSKIPPHEIVDHVTAIVSRFCHSRIAIKC